MLHCDLLTQLNFWLHWLLLLLAHTLQPQSLPGPSTFALLPGRKTSWLTNLSFKSKCTFLRAYFSPQLNILLPVCLVVTVTFSSMSLRHCAIKRIFLCPPGPPLSYPLFSLPPLNASHFSNCRKEISSVLFTSIHLHPNPVPRIFLHPWHIEKCSCEDEYEHLQCYWKFGGATCYLGNCGLRFLSMLVKNLKDSEESLRTTLLGLKRKKNRRTMKL